MPSHLNKLMTEPKNFYFLSKATPHEKGTSDEPTIELTVQDGEPMADTDSSPFLWFSNVFKPKGYQAISSSKVRKVPTKVEPKVFFANERTFLAWLHMSVTLSSISVAIVAFAEANEFSQIYGLMLMPVAIAFCCYSLYMYMKRSSMIRQRHPGPCKSSTNRMNEIKPRHRHCTYWKHSTYLISYFILQTDEDKVGPIALASMLGLAIVVNFGVNLFDLSARASS